VLEIARTANSDCSPAEDARVATCFVIQPFDGGGVFDKRYADVFVPAIKSAGLDPYRVDKDPTATVLIDSIEQGIRDSAACLADISVDNPNVWFELGFALAAGKEVVLACSKGRTKFPFDVQHRNIITYAAESPRDFEKLKEAITNRLDASVKKGRTLEALAEVPLRPSHGLSGHEVTCLTVIMGNGLLADDLVWPKAIQKDMARAGFNALAASLAVKGLLKKGFVKTDVVHDDHGNESIVYSVTDSGTEWLLANEERLILRKDLGGASSEEEPPPGFSGPDDIPSSNLDLDVPVNKAAEASVLPPFLLPAPFGAVNTCTPFVCTELRALTTSRPCSPRPSSA